MPTTSKKALLESRKEEYKLRERGSAMATQGIEAKGRFSEVFSTLRTSMYIVTSAYRNQPAGCTCVWVSRAAFDPPLIAVYLAPERHTYQTIERGKRFCVNVLGESSMQLARDFGYKSGLVERKFKDVAWYKSPNGAPILDNAISYFDCVLEKVIPIGDHRMVLGRIKAAACQKGEMPLLYDPTTFYTDEVLKQKALSGVD